MSLRDLAAGAVPFSDLCTDEECLGCGRVSVHSQEAEATLALSGLAPQLAVLVADAIPVVDELCAWVDTNLVGCVEVQERGETLLRKLRQLEERA